ncbi:MAG: hypothetical protein Q7V58_07590 [Actinomycetota bacterium]|nr:hypothetical protein [Actinomycetota bacterium]
MGLGLSGLAIAAPAQAASERIVLHAYAYENTPGADIQFHCLASPSLVGKTAQIKEVGGGFEASVTIKKNGSCDLAAKSTTRGEHYYVVVVQYELPSGKTKTVRSNPESVFVGQDN